jgi:hypothetical protein
VKRAGRCRASTARSSRRAPGPTAGSGCWTAGSVPASPSSPRPRRSTGPTSAAFCGWRCLRRRS